MATTSVDTEQFRLRAFVESLIDQGEVEIHDELVPLTKMAGHLDGNEKAVLFRKAGSEGVEVVGNLLGNRARIGPAFGMDRADAPEPLSCDAWLDAHPPGFLKYLDAFRSDGLYGRWLRSKAFMVRVGDSIFLHGGLHTTVCRLL